MANHFIPNGLYVALHLLLTFAIWVWYDVSTIIEKNLLNKGKIIMAGNVAIDTLAITKRLEASGMPKKQAEAVAQEQVNFANSNLASKTDIEIIRKDIELVHKDIKISMYASVGITFGAFSGIVVLLLNLGKILGIS